MSKSRQSEYLRRFSGSVHLDTNEELNFERCIADGKANVPKYRHKADYSTNIYQHPSHLRTLEPQNV
jgi:hypothetical protein